jgi:hypothetical protein
MTAEIIGADGSILTVRISARLTQAELAAVQKAAAEHIGRLGRISMLVLAENFAGWEKGGQWSDFAFQEAHDQDIERMAIVGPEQWRDLALLFASKGLRPFPVEFFPSERLADAHAWLHGAPGVTSGG